jgi:hypothetical protein
MLLERDRICAATRPMTLFPREGFILLSEFLCQSLHIRPRFHHLQSIEQRLVLDVAEPPQAGPNRSRPARCAWLMTDCHAAALNRSRQPGPTTSRGARGAAGNWLAGYESGAYDLISLAERRTRRAEWNAPREYEARAGSGTRQGTGRHVSSKRSAEHHSRSL